MVAIKDTTLSLQFFRFRTEGIMYDGDFEHFYTIFSAVEKLELAVYGNFCMHTLFQL